MEQVILGAMCASIGEDGALSRDQVPWGCSLMSHAVDESRNRAGVLGAASSEAWRGWGKKSPCDEADIRLIFAFGMFPGDETHPSQSDCATFLGDFNRNGRNHL